MSANPTKVTPNPIAALAPVERPASDKTIPEVLLPSVPLPDCEMGVQFLSQVLAKFSIGPPLMEVSASPIGCLLEAPTPGPGA